MNSNINQKVRCSINNQWIAIGSHADLYTGRCFNAQISRQTRQLFQFKICTTTRLNVTQTSRQIHQEMVLLGDAVSSRKTHHRKYRWKNVGMSVIEMCETLKQTRQKTRRNICSMKKIKEVEKREERRRQAKIKSDCIHNKKCNENDK